MRPVPALNCAQNPVPAGVGVGVPELSVDVLPQAVASIIAAQRTTFFMKPP
jgi:hypothetical protein